MVCDRLPMISLRLPVAASCSAFLIALSPSGLPTPLPGCLVACCESLLPCPFCCWAFSSFFACSPFSPSCASPCWPLFCCWPCLPFCCLAPCCDFPCWPFWSCCWPLCCCCCWGFTFESRFWKASFILSMMLEFSLELLASCLLPACCCCCCEFLLSPCCPFWLSSELVAPFSPFCC